MMHRPNFITTCGWLSLLAGIAGFVAVAVSSSYRTWITTLQPSLSTDANLAIFFVVCLFCLFQGIALIKGQWWSRITLTLLALGAGVFGVLTLRSSIPEPLALITDARFIIGTGLLVAFLCALYSPHANLFFRPEKPAIPFRIYNVSRQLCLFAAVCLASFGTFRVVAAANEARAAIPKDPVAESKRLRTFENINGFQIYGRLVAYDGKEVTIQHDDGRIFVNPISFYSQKDQIFIRRAVLTAPAE